MAKEVRKEEAERYMRKSEEFYGSATDNYQKRRFNASSFDASQAIILANDALCIFALGTRPSKDHREAVRMHVEALRGAPHKKDVLEEALSKRTKSGYTDAESTENEANILLLKARRFMDWAKASII